MTVHGSNGSADAPLIALKSDQQSTSALKVETFKNFLNILLNISSAVGIVVANKYVFEGYQFKYGTSLTVIHFIITSLGLEVLARLGLFKKKKISIMKVVPLCASFCGFVVLTNLSLQYNSVAFYQMAKVLTTPCVAALQFAFYGVRFSWEVLVTLGLTCLGVLVATATEVNVNFVGSCFAVLAVMVTAVYQILVGSEQKNLDVNAMQLLYYQAPISAIMLAVFCPLFDNVSELFKYPITFESAFAILVSALLALLVNISTFLVIGRTSAITYNMVGHCKLSLVLLSGFLLFDSDLNYKSLFGIGIAFVGILTYSYVTISMAPSKK